MIFLLLRIVLNAVALWVASWLLPGLTVSAPTGSLSGDPMIDTGLAYLFIGLIFGAVNALVRPIAQGITLPLAILTLGLFRIVINAAMLELTSWLSSYTPIRFEVDSFFWTAILGAVVISLISLVLETVTGSRRRSKGLR
ncbi:MULTISPECIES: phage holin family protein [unclassified Arthrobacter]|uniref:phage holin family protein n=1 Tax=unclassified Arthrobacter TaxID=235627 RepID=UPI001E53C826|nr:MULTISPECIES: phage holin family protein [unclassified Arthrobacter]MCC9144409.1 phage holin family protein [Arthrobacter sp. zg-Y919]MDK1275635.1 phage holin family protein [Arthrobacter sp. zg.Y919]MDM7991267.1 phage holin family protein [Arthrobacter sp. zg-Y877]WIB02996.1 phage holin family protein [Arthrobacter sp. zg-Y919]